MTKLTKEQKIFIKGTELVSSPHLEKTFLSKLETIEMTATQKNWLLDWIKNTNFTSDIDFVVTKEQSFEAPDLQKYEFNS